MAKVTILYHVAVSNSSVIERIRKLCTMTRMDLRSDEIKKGGERKAERLIMKHFMGGFSGKYI